MIYLCALLSYVSNLSSHTTNISKHFLFKFFFVNVTLISMISVKHHVFCFGWTIHSCCLREWGLFINKSNEKKLPCCFRTSTVHVRLLFIWKQHYFSCASFSISFSSNWVYMSILSNFEIFKWKNTLSVL